MSTTIMRKGISRMLCLIFPLVASGLSSSGYAQTGHFYPSSFFSSGLVADLCQDKYGNIWIATDYGLNRFDGYHFTTWLHSDTDSSSIKSNTVVSLLSDDKGGLWVGINRGLDHYSPVTNTFEHYRFPGGLQPRVTQIYRKANDSLFISTAGFGGYSLHADGTLTLDQRYAANDEGYYRGIFEDSRGRIWVGTNDNGVVVLDGKDSILFYRGGLGPQKIVSSQKQNKVILLY